MNSVRKPKIKLLEILIERKGLSEAFPMDFILEMVEYTKDNTRLIYLGVKGKICQEVRSLYYQGYSDLSIEEGVITILKELESSVAPGALYNFIELNQNFLEVNAIDISKYFHSLAIARHTLKTISVSTTNKAKSLTDLTLGQLVDPMFKKKFKNRQFKRKKVKQLKHENIIIVADGSSSMVKGGNLEKMMGIIKGIKETFKNSLITKYTCINSYMDISEIEDFPTEHIAGKFNLEYYLNSLPKTDLVIVCTDAYTEEINLTRPVTPVVLFNLSKEDYTRVDNIKYVKV